MLHETFHTLCTHGYAVSLKGATKILRYLRSPDYALSKPIDHALKDLVQMHKIKSWSVFPPVVVQTKSDISDIVNGLDLAWKEKSHEALVDSTLDRIALIHGV
jgi:GR25 family glycosyltransferase involved in LPS biosynthesis